MNKKDILDIFESQKSKEKLTFKNHKCSCILKTSVDKKCLIKIDHEHNHLSCQNEIDVAKIKIKIKTWAKITKSTPAQLFSEVMTSLLESILEELPKEKSIKKNNSKSKDSEFLPEGLTDLKIEENERVIILGSRSNLKLLASVSSNIWYADGNFGLTLIFFFFAIIHPLYLKVDFEKALINATKNILGKHLTINVCLYLLCQSTHRKLAKLVSKNRYQDDDNFNDFCGMLDGPQLILCH
ncbi:hypothetical protein AGLY_012384 [Aphis glycines]|uniref:FLYWCH-type domain-containing protein n=1 Tax=Aphis glycines TaxID=307491 RepID=A0A6G0TAA4_APHGL|nr:hypothetical protein AGLY_012384 [Aphis glycines]